MLILTLITAAAIPVLAVDYEISGADPGLFGKATSVEPATVVGGPIDDSSNVNRSKDSAFVPPPFGSPASNTPGTGNLLTPIISGIPAGSGNTHIAGTGTANTTGNGTVYYPSSPAASDAVSQIDAPYSNKFTLPDGLLYSDGSLGTLSIPRLGISIKVYEDESLENLAKGIGHFKSTSCWEGNVGFAAHNRGLANYFGQIHTLKTGDKIIYTTKLGTRTYEVYFVGQISETDFSRLGRTNANIATLVTCVRDIRDQRWCVQAREII